MKRWNSILFRCTSVPLFACCIFMIELRPGAALSINFRYQYLISDLTNWLKQLALLCKLFATHWQMFVLGLGSMMLTVTILHLVIRTPTLDNTQAPVTRDQYQSQTIDQFELIIELWAITMQTVFQKSKTNKQNVAENSFIIKLTSFDQIWRKIVSSGKYRRFTITVIIFWRLARLEKTKMTK